MARRDFDLKTLLDIPLWEKVQDELAKLTGTAIITIDFKGNPITKHSGRTDFCSVIRENPVSRKRCYRCDALAGLEAVRLGRPYIYLCHCGIVDVAVPILVGDRYLGAVMFGEVRISNNDTDGKVERLVSEISSFQSEGDAARQELMEKYDQLPEMEYKRIVAVADTINAIVNYIVDRAVNSENEAMTYEYLLHSSSMQSSSQLPEIQELRDPNAEYEVMTIDSDVSKSSPVYPALAYVQNHKHEMVTMSDMAKLCHLSPSYFSRLFRRELGENFINYVNRKKVQWAKERLRSSNDSVVQIAQELGFMDSSYFISVFKKFEGTTPLVYRQHKYR
mgnify:CR=1 FL=1